MEGGGRVSRRVADTAMGQRRSKREKKGAREGSQQPRADSVFFHTYTPTIIL